MSFTSGGNDGAAAMAVLIMHGANSKYVPIGLSTRDNNRNGRSDRGAAVTREEDGDNDAADDEELDDDDTERV